MNDFTEAELECLHNAIHLQLQTIAMSEINALRRRDLLDKLQSMIDSYCEHEKSNPSLVMAIACVKCDKPLENGKWCK